MPLLILLTFLLCQVQSPVRDARPLADPTAIGTATVSGRVVTADTGAPVRRAIVRLGAISSAGGEILSGNAGFGRSVFSDADGRFEFPQLPAGSYTLAAIPGSTHATHLGAGYGVRGADRWQPIPASSILELADGQGVQVDLRLPPAAAITGRVVDAAGQPMARVVVNAVRIVPEGRSGGGSATTDDLGQYRIYGLVPGEYVVYTSSNRMAGSPVLSLPQQDSVGVVPTYAPGVTSLARATRVRLDPGTQASLDMQVLEARLATISGTALTSTGEPIKGGLGLEQTDLRFGGAAGSTWMSATGAFRFERVPPGTYDIVARHQGKGLLPLEMGIARVEVVGPDVDDVSIVTRPPSIIEGDIIYDDGFVEGRRAAISLTSPSERRLLSAQPAVTATASTFAVRQVFEPFLLRGTASDANGELSLKAVLLNGKDITDEPRLLSTADGRPQIVFTSRAPAVMGTVLDEAGKPFEESLVVVFADDEQAWRPMSSRVKIARPGKGGVYMLRGLREGRYLVAAVPNDLRFTTAAPDVDLLRALATTAIPVLLNAGEVRTVDVRLHRPGQ